ncbi:MAG: hypothetical protein AAGA48_11335 [Myxococcota bacterium]
MILFHTEDRHRWFLVDEDLALPSGSFAVVRYGGTPMEVDLEFLAPFEVDEAAGQAWIDDRIRRGFRKAGQAFRRFSKHLRKATRNDSAELREVAKGPTVTPEEVFGVRPSEMYRDPEQLRKGVGQAFEWLTARLQPDDAEPNGSRSDPGDLLKSLSQGLRAVREHADKRFAEALARRAAEPAETKPPQLLPVGFFRELPHGDPEGPSLVESRRFLPLAHQPQIVAYLRQAPLLEASTEPVADVLESSAEAIGTASVRTDGLYCWPDDLPGYLERYNVALPPVFLGHLAARGWDLGDIDVTGLQRPPFDSTPGDGALPK